MGMCLRRIEVLLGIQKKMQKWWISHGKIVYSQRESKTIRRMGKFELMVLPYAIDALEPVISKQTLEFHHGKHLAGYVNNLNGLLPGSVFEEATLEDIVCKAQGGMLNNAGQILNHNMYFEQVTGEPTKSAPTGQLADAIERDFG